MKPTMLKHLNNIVIIAGKSQVLGRPCLIGNSKINAVVQNNQQKRILNTLIHNTSLNRISRGNNYYKKNHYCGQNKNSWGTNLLLQTKYFGTANNINEEKKGNKDEEETSFIDKAKGTPGAGSPATSFSDILFAGIGTFLGIGSLSMIHYGLAPIDETMILGSFGATSVLIFGAPAAPFSQPRNVIGGHFVAAFCGVCAAQYIHIPFDLPHLAAPLAVSLACMSMMATRTVHPPAGGTALIAALGSTQIQEMGFYYLVPTAFGATTLVCLGVLINNVHSKRSYPMYWWGK